MFLRRSARAAFFLPLYLPGGIFIHILKGCDCILLHLMVLYPTTGNEI